MDKRERIMQLTNAGKLQAEPIYKATTEMFENAFNVFGKEKSTQLFALMSKFSQICRDVMNK